MRFQLSLPLLLGVTTMAHAADYKLTITNTGPQSLSPLFVSAGDDQFDIFSLGSAANVGIKHIAEMGNATDLISYANAAGSHVSYVGLLGNSPLVPGGTRTLFFSTDSAHPYLSFAAMLGKTNDGFIGESYSSMGINLFSGGTPKSVNLDVLGSRAWDAGTELNTQNAVDLAFKGGSGNPAEDPMNAHIRVHDGVIPNVGDSWMEMPSWSQSTKLANIQVEAVPEPTTMAALGLGVFAMFRKRRTAKA